MFSEEISHVTGTLNLHLILEGNLEKVEYPITLVLYNRNVRLYLEISESRCTVSTGDTDSGSLLCVM